MSPAVRAFLLLPALFSAADYYMEASRVVRPLGFDECTLIGTVRGFGIDIDAAFASTIRSGTIVACWRGTCRTAPLDFMLDRRFAIVEMLDLPAEPVQVALHFTDNDGSPLPARTITVVPRMVYPNGPRCGADGPQQNLRIDAEGHLLPARFAR
ncbi:hypothetical protein LVJ94_19300 [Pendulispora rubella]|uniref:Uncharacterized protein n=1 Tax=Pendulispora rubella TaxID=2741070 RepID=A0ABZ2LEP0_9BACT